MKIDVGVGYERTYLLTTTTKIMIQIFAPFFNVMAIARLVQVASYLCKRKITHLFVMFVLVLVNLSFSLMKSFKNSISFDIYFYLYYAFGCDLLQIFVFMFAVLFP